MRAGSLSRRHSLLAAACAGVLALGVAGAGATTAAADTASPSAPATAPSTEKVTLTIGWLNDIVSANPFSGYLAEDYELWQMMYPTLAAYSAADFEPIPDLAEIGVESPDHKTWTYKIRSDAQWSDGVPLTAKDAAYSFNRIINGKYEKGNFGGYLKSVTKAEAPDDTTLVLTVDKPVAFMRNLPIYIIPEHVWSKIDGKAVKSYANEPVDGQPVVGAGPFLLAERKTEQYIRMVKNPNYYGTAPAVDEIVFRIYKNSDAMAQALKKGEIDFASGLEANVMKALESDPTITTNPGAYPGFNEIAFNTGAEMDDGTPIGDGNALLKDPKLRTAMAWAVNKQQLVDRVLGGYGKPAEMVMPPMYSFWSLQPAETIGYDPEKAKQLLDQAGYTVGDDGVRVAPNGERLSFRLYGRQSSETSKKTVEFVKSYFEEVGIETEVKLMGDGVLGERITAGEYDMFEWGWIADPDPDYMMSIFTCDKRSDNDGGTPSYDISDSFFCDTTFDKLYAEQATATDRAARQAIVQQMQQILYDNTPYILTFYYDSLEAYRNDRFTNFTPQPADGGALTLQFGTWSYQTVTPISEEAPATPGATAVASATTDSSGSSTGWIVAAIAAVIIIGGGAFFLGRRRGGSADFDKE